MRRRYKITHKNRNAKKILSNPFGRPAHWWNRELSSPHHWKYKK